MSDDRWPLGHSTLRARTAAAVADPVVPARVQRAVDRFASHRAEGLGELHDPDGLREAARALKASILDDLPAVVDRLEEQATAAGVQVHRAADAAAAQRIVTRIAGGARVVKSKSMATEEIGLNEALEAAGATVVETDLGEWIIQLAGHTPSHIIAPAVHHDRHSILEVFERVAGAHGVAAEPEALNAFARERLRAEFLAAEVGITGVNFAVADTGSLVLVTNEGNGRLVTSLPRVHVAVLGTERLVRTWAELDLFLTLLTRSATGQRLTSYTSVLTGPRRSGEPDGPDELHLVILDNGRTALLHPPITAGSGSGRSTSAPGPYREMLGCVRCGACLNVCPVYRQTGGHAYGWVYPGPMGAVLTPLLAAHEPGAAELAGASTLCGACTDACPVAIPLPDLLLRLRRDRAEAEAGRAERAGWRAWSEAWSHPLAYRASTRAAGWARGLGANVRLLPGASRWTDGRAAPVPAPRRFRDRWPELAATGRAATRGTRTTGSPGAPVVPARPGARPGPIPVRPRPGSRSGTDPDHRFAAHPPPTPTTAVPRVGYRRVDPHDLLGTFVTLAGEAGATVHVVEGHEVPADLLADIARRHAVATVVASADPEARATAAALHAAALATLVPTGSAGGGGDSGSDDPGADRTARAGADLGVTSSVALVAATGSLVVDATVAGDRTTSLLPRVHLAVVPADRLVATPGDLWRRFDEDPASLPSNLVVVTGPSRTGDIEQLLTVGVHGPTALEIVVTGAVSP